MKAYVRQGLVWSGLMLVVMAGIWAWAYAQLPQGDAYPLHWNAQGVADSFGTRSDALLAVGVPVGIGAALAVLLASLPVIDPRHKHIDESRPAYLAIWMGTMTFLVALQGLLVWIMSNTVAQDLQAEPAQPVRFIVLGVCLLFALIGNFLPKTRSSYTFGIRTPWTLASENVWHKTHRLAGPLFVLAGLGGAAGALLADGAWITLAPIGLLLGMVVVTVVYSYLAYRHEEQAG